MYCCFSITTWSGGGTTSFNTPSPRGSGSGSGTIEFGSTGAYVAGVSKFKVTTSGGSEFSIIISDNNQFKLDLISTPPSSNYEKGVIWELLNLQSQSLPLTPEQTIWLRNANKNDVLTITIGQSANFGKTAYIFNIGDVIEVKMLFKYLLERVANATQLINTSRQTILVDMYAHTNALNYMPETYNFYMLVIENNIAKIPAESIMEVIKNIIFDKYLFNLVSNQVVLEQISLKLELASLAEKKLVNKPFTLAGGLTGVEHFPSGRTFLIRTSSLGTSNNSETGSHRLPFISRTLEVLNRQSNVNEVTLVVRLLL